MLAELTAAGIDVSPRHLQLKVSTYMGWAVEIQSEFPVSPVVLVQTEPPASGWRVRVYRDVPSPEKIDLGVIPGPASDAEATAMAWIDAHS